MLLTTEMWGMSWLVLTWLLLAARRGSRMRGISSCDLRIRGLCKAGCSSSSLGFQFFTTITPGPSSSERRLLTVSLTRSFCVV